jgi:hypothetical protein
MWLALVAALVAVGAAATIGAVAGYRTAADVADANYGPRLAAAESSLAAFQTQAAEASAEAADVPDLKALADQYFAPGAEISGTADALDVTITDYRLLTDLPALGNFLAALGFSDAVLDRMNRTRALDGTLSAEGHNCNVTWTYHPDDGLEMVFEAGPGT